MRFFKNIFYWLFQSALALCWSLSISFKNSSINYIKVLNWDFDYSSAYSNSLSKTLIKTLIKTLLKTGKERIKDNNGSKYLIV